MAPSSSSSLSRAAILLALTASSPHNGASFPMSPRLPVDSRPTMMGLASSSSAHRRRASPLHSTVDMPMRPMEEEKEKNSTSKEDQREWRQVVGGFVPKFLKRGKEGDSSSVDIKYPEVQMVDTIQDYKRVVVDEKDSIVVVRFFAPWCKSCKAAHPLFKKMVSDHSKTLSPPVKFVEVPLTKDTAYIHEGLGVPSVPYGHIYHPEAGLVEERKINKRVFKEFRDALDSYVVGSCDLPVEEDLVDEDATKCEDDFQ